MTASSATARVVKPGGVYIAVMAVVFVAALPAAAGPGNILETEPVQRMPIRLMDVRLHQSGSVLAGERPNIASALPLTIECSWMPRVELSSSVPIQITFWDGLGLISRQFPFRAGPERAGDSWRIGAQYAESIQIDMREVAQAFSGRAHVVIAVETAGPEGRTFEPVTLLPVNVDPLVEPLRLGEDLWRATLGDNVRVLPGYAKLGPGAAFELAVPDPWRTNNRSIAIVSSLAYRGGVQGEPVADIELIGTDGSRHMLQLLTGTDTARCDFDAYPPGSLRHDKVTVFHSRDSAQLSQSGRPVQLHSFITVRELPQELASIERVVVRYTADVVLDVQGVALLSD